MGKWQILYLRTGYRSKLGWFFWFGTIHVTIRRNLADGDWAADGGRRQHSTTRMVQRTRRVRLSYRKSVGRKEEGRDRERERENVQAEGECSVDWNVGLSPRGTVWPVASSGLLHSRRRHCLGRGLVCRDDWAVSGPSKPFRSNTHAVRSDGQETRER